MAVLQEALWGEGTGFHAQNVTSHSKYGKVLFGIITFVCMVFFPSFATSSHCIADVRCYEVCCDRIFKRVSLYINHKCDLPKAITRREDLKRQSEERLEESLDNPEPRLHISKRRKTRRNIAHRPNPGPCPHPVGLPEISLDVESMNKPASSTDTSNLASSVDASRLEYSLSSNVSFDFSAGAPLNMPTGPDFATQPAATFPTYGSGARAPLMFKGTISGPQHDGMFLPPEQVTFFSEGLEREPGVASAHGGAEWISGHGSFSGLNLGTQN